MWLTPRILAYGFILPAATKSAAQKKALRQNPRNIVRASEVNRVLEVFRGVVQRFEREIESEKTKLVEEYKNTKGYRSDLLELLRPELQKSFSFLHDYKQFIARVRQNINVVLENRYPGGTLEEKLNRALPAEAAIYWASILMEEKLETMFLLLHPERIYASPDTVFRLHGLVLKYVRIYQASFTAKNIVLRVTGESRGEIKGDPVAAAIIPHTFIDNALKYSPRGSEVVVDFTETVDDVELRVASFGPEICTDELDKIFDIFFRGRDAVKQEEEGTGVGLYLAQLAAERLHTRIRVDQVRKRDRFWTTFSVKFRRER